MRIYQRACLVAAISVGFASPVLAQTHKQEMQAIKAQCTSDWKQAHFPGIEHQVVAHMADYSQKHPNASQKALERQKNSYVEGIKVELRPQMYRDVQACVRSHAPSNM
jgi:hypothetical protein